MSPKKKIQRLSVADFRARLEHGETPEELDPDDVPNLLEAVATLTRERARTAQAALSGAVRKIDSVAPTPAKVSG